MFRVEIFPTPIWSGHIENEDILQKAEELAYNFRDEVKEAGVVSQGWDDKEITDDRLLFDKKGVTSFYSDNLATNEKWEEITDFIINMAGTMLSDTHDVTGMRIANMWTTIYPKGAFVPQHIHSYFEVSGVFYVKAPENCGDIVFQDPAWVAKTMNIKGANKGTFPGPGTKWSHSPTAGDMLLFPSWLPHSTKQNESEEDRIIISFNLLFEGVSYLEA